MGEHPPVSSSPTVLENTQPPIGKGPPSMARNPANCFVSQDHPTDKNSSSSPQHPSLHKDPSFHSLIQKARSHNPSHRPNLLSVVLQLQQTVSRYFLCLSALPLPAPASLSASLSLYMPRTPVITPSPIPIEDFPGHLASGTPSPSRPSGPSYPYHPHLSHTVNVDLFSDTRGNRPPRESRPIQANHSQSPMSLEMFSEVASRANRLPPPSSEAPSEYVSPKHANIGRTVGPCNDASTLPRVRERHPLHGLQGHNPPVALDGFE